MRNFFWEGHKGGKINHLVKWKLITGNQSDGGLGIRNLRAKNAALLAKWGWRFMKEKNSLWRQVVQSIHGKSLFGWHTSGLAICSLRSPWVSISRTWLKVEALAMFKVENGRTTFWLEPWVNKTPLIDLFPRFFRISLNPRGAIAEFWDPSTTSWSINFRRNLKKEEIVEFQNLLGLISSFPITTTDDSRHWELETNEKFSVKSLVKHLSKTSPIGKLLEDSLWKSKSPRRVNITVWIKLEGLLNCASMVQSKLPAHFLSPHICHLCLADQEDLQHLFFSCKYARNCWFCLFEHFNLSWVFGNKFKENVLHLLIGPRLKSKPNLLWANAVKAILS